MLIQLPPPTSVLEPPDIQSPLTQPMVVTAPAGSFHLKRVVLEDGPRAGVELLYVDTGRVRAAICPTRGLSLWQATIDGHFCGWKSPVEGPIHPAHVAIAESSGLGWLDGFDELLVRCGMRSFGAPDFDAAGNLKFGLHGRVGNIPARSWRVNLDEEHSLLEVIGEVHESRFLQYNLRLTARYLFQINEPSIGVQDRVTNASDVPTSMQMLYHINVGQPFLGRGSKLHITAPRSVARDARAAEDLNAWRDYLGPTAGYAEQVYFFAPPADSDGWARSMLAAPDSSCGFAVHFRPETLPYFSQWKNTVAEADGYVTGLEPGTGFPNPRTFEESQGRTVQLAGGHSVDFTLRMEAISGRERVEKFGARLAGQIGTQAFDPDWCLPRS
ncbi:MAG: aldose 1-epimerase family protein [Planctomycetales bacterium]|nr:aldose 1-epimerase family protein [Planctomycetales bacterium]